MNTKPLGNLGEEIAAKYLVQKQYTILERQYRCRIGEIDIIAVQENTVVFVEVKTRRSTDYGPAALAVTRYKQEKIKRTAMWYAHLKCSPQTSFRFDVIEVYLFEGGINKLQHYVNAFEM